MTRELAEISLHFWTSTCIPLASHWTSQCHSKARMWAGRDYKVTSQRDVMQSFYYSICDIYQRFSSTQIRKSQWNRLMTCPENASPISVHPKTWSEGSQASFCCLYLDFHLLSYNSTLGLPAVSHPPFTYTLRDRPWSSFWGHFLPQSPATIRMGKTHKVTVWEHST